MRLDMGKPSVRFKRLDDLPLDCVGEAVAQRSIDELIAHYKRSRERRSRK